MGAPQGEGIPPAISGRACGAEQVRPLKIGRHEQDKLRPSVPQCRSMHQEASAVPRCRVGEIAPTADDFEEHCRRFCPRSPERPDWTAWAKAERRPCCLGTALGCLCPAYKTLLRHRDSAQCGAADRRPRSPRRLRSRRLRSPGRRSALPKFESYSSICTGRIGVGQCGHSRRAGSKWRMSSVGIAPSWIGTAMKIIIEYCVV
jgi:hypothetical protein